MKYRRLGRTGLRVSELSLGAWQTYGDKIDSAATRDILLRAVDLGINYFDLADAYANGGAERAVGTSLKDVPRSKLVLSSKLFWPMSDDINDRGLSRKHIMESVERSLRNLGTDYLDLYFCHREDPDVPLDETQRAMDDLVRQGKVLYWGTSLWEPKTLSRAHSIAKRRGLYEPVVEQPPYNLLTRWPEKRLFPCARRLGMGLVVWSPLAGGVLTGKYNEGVPEGSRGADTEWLDEYLVEENLERVRRLSELAEANNLKPAQLAIRWVLQRPEISSVITGATHILQLEENVASVSSDVPKGVFSELDALFR